MSVYGVVPFIFHNDCEVRVRDRGTRGGLRVCPRSQKVWHCSCNHVVRLRLLPPSTRRLDGMG